MRLGFYPPPRRPPKVFWCAEVLFQMFSKMHSLNSLRLAVSVEPSVPWRDFCPSLHACHTPALRICSRIKVKQRSNTYHTGG